MEQPEYIKEAIKWARSIGWTGDVVGVRLLHPEGRTRFGICGAVIVYSTTNCENRRLYLNIMFPGQYLPLHHHESTKHVLRVIAGSVTMFNIPGTTVINPGEYICQKIGEKYGYGTKYGALLIGICHKNNGNDYYWETIGENVDGSHSTIVPYNDTLTPFKAMIEETYTRYAQENAKSIDSDAVTLVGKKLDPLIPQYKEGKLVVDRKVVFRAIFSGRLEFLQWILQSYGGSVFDYENGLVFARKGGAVDVEQWLKNIFCVEQ